MSDVAKFPYMTIRKDATGKPGMRYYKRDIPPELRDIARRHFETEAAEKDQARNPGKKPPAQFWRTLGKRDPKQVELSYAAIHKEVEDCSKNGVVSCKLAS